MKTLSVCACRISSFKCRVHGFCIARQKHSSLRESMQVAKTLVRYPCIEKRCNFNAFQNPESPQEVRIGPELTFLVNQLTLFRSWLARKIGQRDCAEQSGFP